MKEDKNIKLRKMDIKLIGDCNNSKGCLVIMKNTGDVNVSSGDVEIYKDSDYYAMLSNMKNPLGFRYEFINPGKIITLRAKDICNDNNAVTVKTFFNESDEGLFFVYNSSILCPDNSHYNSVGDYETKNITDFGRVAILLIGDCIDERGCLLAIKNTGNNTLSTSSIRLYKAGEYYGKISEFKDDEGVGYSIISPGRSLILRVGPLCAGNELVTIETDVRTNSSSFFGRYRENIMCPENLSGYNNK